MPRKTGLAAYIDHTLLKPTATAQEVLRVCREAVEYGFASVCVGPAYVALAAGALKGRDVKISTVVGFPLGFQTPATKVFEAREALAQGAREIDMVMNLGYFKSGDFSRVLDDIESVRRATRGRVLKVIIETGCLSREEKVRAARLVRESGADFVKTSTGFGPGGATLEDVRLLRSAAGPALGIKAAGGIRDPEMAWRMIEAGATRLGTSASVEIVAGSGRPLNRKSSGKKSGKGKY